MGDQEDFSQLPLTEQFTHKNWKARKGGYETATKEFKTCQPTDSIVRDFIFESNIWKGACGDSNVAAQQEALNAYNAFLDIAGPEGAKKTRGSTVAPIVEKGLTGRPAAKAAAMESLLLLIELDKADPIVEELLGFLSHKLPKLIAASLNALAQIVHAYGCKVVEPKPVVKLLPKAFGHADKNVRAEAQNLTVELYRWLREAMKPLFWGELKEVQQKDLDKLFEPVQSEPPAKQERLLRTQQAAREQAEAADDGGGAGEDDDEDAPDLEPEYVAVDIAPKLPKDLNERLASTKWKDRKEVLDEVFALANVPAIKDGSFDDLIRGCAKSMKDANVSVVTVAANVIECLAKGLKKGFAKYRSIVLAPMLERFKEKKVLVTDAIGAACDAVFASTTFPDIQNEVFEAMKNKNPQVKEHTTKFLARAIRNTREVPSIESTKEIAEASKKLLSESAPALRDAGCEVLGALWKVMGDRNVLAHLEGIDDLKKAKIAEFRDAAEVKSKWKPKAAPAAAPKAAAAAAPGRKPALGAKKTVPPSARKAPPAATPRAVTPPPVDVPLQPNPTSRPATKVPAGLRTPGGGLKTPSASGLQRPGLGLKAPGASMASPKRQGMVFDDGMPAVVAKPSLPGAGRGLAGRPLGKPMVAPASPPPPPREDYAPSSALSSIERQELSDLRAEIELLRHSCSDLRQDKMKLSSQIAELQNQNAQLIEDHTRDVLQIKAKETQLVRARSDAENAEDRANSLSKEIDRLKREMSRLGRAQSMGRDSPVDGMNGDLHGARSSFSSRNSTYQAAGARALGGMGHDGVEGKENVPGENENGHYGAKLSGYSATQTSRPYSTMSSGRATPAMSEDGGPHTGLSRSQAEGQESWRRAAEVTQNLKARIEMMKARQNMNRS